MPDLTLNGKSLRDDYRFPFNLFVKTGGGNDWRALADAYRAVSADPTWKPTQQMLLLEDILAA